MVTPPTTDEYNHYASLMFSLYGNELYRVRAVGPDRCTGAPSAQRHSAYILGKYLEHVNWGEFMQYNCVGDIPKKTLDNIWQGWCAKGNKIQIDLLLEEIKQKDIEIMQQKYQLKYQLKSQTDIIIIRETQLKQQENTIKQLRTQIHSIRMQLNKQENRLTQMGNLNIQLNWQKNKLNQQAKQIEQLIDFKGRFVEQEQIINKLSTQMIGIEPDLIQLSDLYHEQECKSIQLETELQYKNNQLAEQEENIKQLLAALDSTQSKQGLVSTISRYFN